MDPHNDGEVIKVPPGDSQLGQITDSIFSLNEAWLHIPDRRVVDARLSEVIFPLMRSCFFGGALHAVLLLQNDHGDRLAADIAAFLMKGRQS
jgi:hypothetical protein